MRTDKAIAKYLGIEKSAADESSLFTTVEGWPVFSTEGMKARFLEDANKAFAESEGGKDLNEHPFRNMFNWKRLNKNFDSGLRAAIDELPLSGEYAAAGALGTGGTAALIAAMLSKDHKLRNAVIAGLVGAAAGGAGGYGLGEYAKGDIAEKAIGKVHKA